MTDGLYDHLLGELARRPRVPRYSGSQAAKIVGASYRQIDYWISSGVIVPDDPSPGSGYHRGLTVDDLVRLRVVVTLLDSGMSLQRARRMVAAVDITEDTAWWGEGPLRSSLDVGACRRWVEARLPGKAVAAA